MLENQLSQDTSYETLRELVVPIDARNNIDFLHRAHAYSNQETNKRILLSWLQYYYDTEKCIIFELPTETIEAMRNERE